MKRITAFVFLLAISQFFLAQKSLAEPSGAKASVISVRSYDSGQYSYAIIEVNNTTLCNTDHFVIPLDSPGGVGMLSAAITALSAQKQVVLEVSNVTGCNGWGSRLQSLYLFN
ncbi:hypothetical protein [Nitrospirillum iridis]|uniref:Uncharacterized protein n=1 Tax=Nitrospirillum iridis TaxID=765888 RepID=A0A7X0EE18_9PROT|nr:hypothetical protein [Nitrospirillum iridis]MBB6253393.1 hypothetical protein [Nitrospirillum iridis]